MVYSLKVVVLLVAFAIGVTSVPVKEENKEFIKGTDGQMYRIVRDADTPAKSPAPKSEEIVSLSSPKVSKDEIELKKEDTSKSAAKTEDTEKARTHIVGYGMDSFLEGLKYKLLHKKGFFPGQPGLGYYQEGPYMMPGAAPLLPAAGVQSYVSPPAVSYVNQVVQKPAYAVSQQVIHKPVISEIQEVIHKPVYTEFQEVIHKPVITELQQIIKKPLVTEHIVKKPDYNSVKQEVMERPLHLQAEQYHISDRPYSQIVHLPTQVIQPYASHVVQTPVVHQTEMHTAYHVPSVAASYSAPSLIQPATAGVLSPYVFPAPSATVVHAEPSHIVAEAPLASLYGSSSSFGSYVAPSATYSSYAAPSASFGSYVAPSYSSYAAPSVAYSSGYPLTGIASSSSYGWPSTYTASATLGGANEYQYYTQSECARSGGRSGCGGGRAAENREGESQQYSEPINFQVPGISPSAALPYPASMNPFLSRNMNSNADQQLNFEQKTMESPQYMPGSVAGDVQMVSVDSIKAALEEEESKLKQLRASSNEDEANLETVARRIDSSPELKKKFMSLIMEAYQDKSKIQTRSSEPIQVSQQVPESIIQKEPLKEAPKPEKL